MNNDKITVIHHSADFDGLFCREIARKFLGNENVEYIGWDYGNAKIPFPNKGTVYVLDLSPECFADAGPNIMSFDLARLVWIDHHKTAIEKYDGVDDPEANLKMHPRIAGYRIDGVAACRLAWQWFAAADCDRVPECLPNKGHFINREVTEPLAVRLAGEYDIWDKRDERVDVFQLGLRSRELTDGDWGNMLSITKSSSEDTERLVRGTVKNLIEPDGTFVPVVVCDLLTSGELIQSYVNGRDAGIVNALGFVVEFEGVKFLALNSAGKGSLQFAAKDVPETGHDALLKFNWTGDVWDVSLYHAKHRTDLDLSGIAKKYGGGGHRGACGFRAKELPFLAVPAPSDFKERVKLERLELDEKRVKLIGFMETDKYLQLSHEERDRLSAQERAMRAYSEVITQRLEADFK